MKPKLNYPLEESTPTLCIWILAWLVTSLCMVCIHKCNCARHPYSNIVILFCSLSCILLYIVTCSIFWHRLVIDYLII